MQSLIRNNHNLMLCVYVSVSVTALAGTTSPLQAKVRYQQEALDMGTKLTLELN